MKLIKKSNVILTVSERWDFQYKGSNDEDKIRIGEDLRFFKPTTEKQVTAIIGNGSWTRTVCDECKRDKKVLVQLGEEPNWESATVNVCLKCLENAVKLAKNEN